MSLIRDKIKKGLRSERGALAPAFAIILPGLLAMMSFGLDSANLLLTKTRLANAMDEAALAVSASGKSNLNEDELKAAQQMAASYVRYHLPGINTVPVIQVSGISEDTDANGFKSIRYELSAGLKIPLIFDLGALGSIGHEVNTGSGNRLVKKFSSVPADYVFVVDFSTSMAGAKLRDLKAVVKEIGEFAVENNENTKIALVPFSTGVSVKLPGTNERGGDRVGCSNLFVPKEDYDIDYEFWADKYTYNSNEHQNRMYNMDRKRYDYYFYFVKPSAPAMTNDQFQQKWCVRNASSGAAEGRYTYSCKNDSDPKSDIFSVESQIEIKKNYQRAYNIKVLQGKSYTFVTDETINYEATMKKMFTEEAIITFPLPWSSMDSENYRNFYRMCHQGGWYNHLSNNDMSRSSARSWLIELTSDLSVLDEFQNMWQQGWTQISSGLLRSVPVMMKGKNKRKVFILISDGNDNIEKGVTYNFLTKYNLCDRIKEGIIERSSVPGAKVEMYFISVTSGATATKRVNLWANYCVGEGNSKTSTTRESLIKDIKGIMSDETGHFAS